MPIQAQIVVGELPEGFCPTSEQARLNGYMETIQIFFPGTASIFNYGSSTPTVDNQGYPWFRLNGSGQPTKWYVFNNGAWISEHPIPPSSPGLLLYVGTEASIETFDGGEAGAVTATSGPMWEIYAAMEGRFPIGINATYPFGDTGGSATVVQTVAQMPSHHHEIPSNISLASTGGDIAAAGDNLLSFAAGDRIDSANTGGNDPMPILPPYKALYYLRRTSRGYYRL